MGAKGKMWHIVKERYEVPRSTVLVDGEKSSMFSEEQCVKQGCSLSPVYCSLFSRGRLG